MPHPVFPYSLAAIDIDDTLIGPDKRISAANRSAVERLRELGCRTVLASGRRHANTLIYAHELRLDDFVVSSQGARVEHARSGEILHRASVPAADVASLAGEGLDRGFTVMLWLADRVYANASTEWIDSYREETRDEPVTIADPLRFAGEAAEKVIWAAEPAVITAAAREMGIRYSEQLSITITTDWSLEFTALDANKDRGVAAVARHYGIAPEAVLAFGDGNNDASLLAWAGLGVAMPHGRPSARSAARMVAAKGDPESALARAVASITRERGDAKVA